VYELSPEAVGQFDFVFAGSVLGHLRDPVAALAAIATVLRGELLSVDFISAPLTLSHPGQPLARFEGRVWPLWWVPNLTAYRRLFTAAGLRPVEQGRPFFVRRGLGYSGAYGREDAERQASPLTRLRHAASSRVGNMHAWVRARAA
jgi:SAM-dependent methyltransferase